MQNCTFQILHHLQFVRYTQKPRCDDNTPEGSISRVRTRHVAHATESLSVLITNNPYLRLGLEINPGIEMKTSGRLYWARLVVLCPRGRETGKGEGEGEGASISG